MLVEHMEQEDEGTVAITGQVEIDTRRPFRSVKEAVTLFGERVLVKEIYGNRLKEMQAVATENENPRSTMGALTQELEETKQSLKIAREEINLMSKWMQILEEQLEETKKELKQLKARDYGKQPVCAEEIEELKFVETTISKKEKGKRYVKFTSPPCELPLADEVITSKEEMAEKKPSFAKKNRKIKTLIPLIRWLFPSKKGFLGGQEAYSLMNC